MTRTHPSPLVRFLRDPSRALAHTLPALEHTAMHAVPLALASAWPGITTTPLKQAAGEEAESRAVGDRADV